MDVSGLRRRIFPRGTRLYRVADGLGKFAHARIAGARSTCTDTGKLGVYFATYPFLSMAIATEYHRDMVLGEFVTTADIVAAEGKYAFRDLAPPGFYDFIPARGVVPVRPQDNINHYDECALPILKLPGREDNVLPYDFLASGCGSGSSFWAGELFVSEPLDLTSIVLRRAFAVRAADVPTIARSLGLAVNAENAGDWLSHLQPATLPSPLSGGSPTAPPACVTF